MGGCVGTTRRRRDGSGSRRPSAAFSDSTSNPDSVSTKNRPLRHEKIRWKSDIPLTEGQLKSKRDEFWDTAPAFEGKSEIWNALKAAVEATEVNDYDLAQAILDGACISLPNGSLVECYDELGARYAIPVYCLSYPINIVFGRDNGSPETSTDGRDTPAEESEPVESGKKGDNSKSRTNKDKKKKEREEGKDMKIKVRISLTSSSDTRLLVNTAETVLSAKKRLYAQVEKMGEPSKQRWYFSGKLLTDKTRIGDANIPSGHVVQCILNEKPDPNDTDTTRKDGGKKKTSKD